MVKHTKKNYQRGKKPIKHSIKKVSEHVAASKRSKSKYIQRGRDMEEYHRKQRATEEKYHNQTADFMLQQELTSVKDMLIEDEEEENPFEQLVAQLPTKKYVEEEETDLKDEIERDVVDNDDEEKEEAENIENENDYDDDNIADHDSNIKAYDAFAKHLDYDASPEHIEQLLATTAKTKSINLNWPILGKFNLELLQYDAKDVQTILNESNSDHSIETFSSRALGSKDLINMGIKKSLIKHMKMPLSKLQSELLTIIGQYHDIYYPKRTFENAEEVRYAYCVHLLNHMLKTRARILNNNAKLAATAKTKKINKYDLIVPESLRDQGLVRPKVLVIVPFRDSALRIVNMLIELLFGKNKEPKSKKSINNYERFLNEYGGNTLYFPKTNPKPVDYEQIFSGNTDDNFRIGISLTKNSIKLYTEFYASDIIIASPLALRLVIAGSTDSNERDYDFINSIELLIIDQAELLFAQNWENLLHVMEHMHLQPQSLRDTNFQRVRQWYLTGLAKYYRQTLLFSSHELPEFRALFSNKCNNYEGKVRIQNIVEFGNIRNVIVSVSQIFQRIHVSNLATMFDERFNYFIQKVLPRFKNPAFAHCMIYVPSYFDYVRIRNYFRKETINFVQICEYTEKGKISKARDAFFHSGAQFLLYSERAHFFRRTRIKGIRHLIMYQPPTWPNFYAEMINLMHEANQNPRDGLNDSMSITILYTKYDMLQLSNAIGTENASKIINSTKSMHTFANQ